MPPPKPSTFLTPTWSCASAISVRGLFEISCVQYRAGTPQCLPLTMSPSIGYGLPTVMNAWCIDLVAEAKKILDDNGLEGAAVELVDLPIPNTLVPRQTLLIVAPWMSDSRMVWVNLVRQVKCLIDARLEAAGAHPQYLMGVEIMATELHRPRQIVSLETRLNIGIEKSWCEIVNGLRDTFRRFKSTDKHVVAIDLARRLGNPSDDKDMNRFVVDVQISYTSPETTWDKARKEAEALLEKFGHGLELHMRHAYGFFDKVVTSPTGNGISGRGHSGI